MTHDWYNPKQTKNLPVMTGQMLPAMIGQLVKYLENIVVSRDADMRTSLSPRYLARASRSTISMKSLSRSRTWTSSMTTCVTVASSESPHKRVRSRILFVQ